MRRFLSSLLLATFALPMLTALLALSDAAESRLPACCRRNGAHHCMMPAGQMAELLNRRPVAASHSQCPLFPKTTAPAHHPMLGFEIASALFTVLPRLLALFRGAETGAPVALKGVRHKRGPPAAPGVCVFPSA